MKRHPRHTGELGLHWLRGIAIRGDLHLVHVVLRLVLEVAHDCELSRVYHVDVREALWGKDGENLEKYGADPWDFIFI